MFHVKHRRFLGLIAVLGLLGLLAAGCSRAGAHGWASPVTAGNLRYVTTGAGHLDAIASDGSKVWRFPNNWDLPDSRARKLKGIYGPPALTSDGKVAYLGDYDGYLYAFRPGDFSLDAQTKPKAASLKLNGAVVGGVALDSANDMLFVTSDKAVYEVKASEMAGRIDNKDASVTHSVIFQTQGEIWARPVVADGKLLIASLDGKLYAVDEKTGKEIWRYDGGRGLVTTPVVSGDVVLVGGFNENLVAVSLADGSEKWSFGTPNWIWSRPAVANGVAYFGDFNGVLHAIDVSTGSEKWSSDLGKGSIRSGPAVVGNMVVVAGEHGSLFGIDVTSQQKVWEKDLGVGMLADLVADGTSVLLAPSGCVTPSGENQKVYYLTVDPANGDLTRSTGVC
jgi:outer membrane protein assembly factor BamB